MEENQIKRSPLDNFVTNLVVVGHQSGNCLYQSDYQLLGEVSSDPASFKVHSFRVGVKKSLFRSLICNIDVSYLNLMTGSIHKGYERKPNNKSSQAGQEIILQPTEYLVEIECHSRTHIHHLVIRTDKGRRFEFGRPEKEKVYVQAGMGCHLTLMRTGISKALKFIMLDRVPLKHPLQQVQAPLKAPHPVLRLLAGSILSKCRIVSDFQMHDRMGIFIPKLRIVSCSFRLDSHCIVGSHFIYMDSKGRFVNGQAQTSWEIGSTKSTVTLDITGKELLTEFSVWMNKDGVCGVKLTLSSGRSMQGGLLKGLKKEVKAPLGFHLTGFESMVSRYTECFGCHAVSAHHFNEFLMPPAEEGKKAMTEFIKNQKNSLGLYDYPELNQADSIRAEEPDL